MPDDDEQEQVQTEEQQDDEHQDDQQTYPAKVVKDLRKENASYRDRARTAETNLETVQRELFTARTSALGLLADPDDLAYDAELFADKDKHAAAVDDLITRKPHLKIRKVDGDVGQGERSQNTAPQNFSALLR